VEFGGIAEAAMALWMRGSVSFVALRELISYIEQHPEGVWAKEMEVWAREKARLRIQSGKLVSKTTVYHYRNTLRHLGILVVTGRRYRIAKEQPLVAELLEAIRPGAPDLSLEERELFARFVVQDRDCQKQFFDLFMPPGTKCYDLEAFLENGRPVVWRREDEGIEMLHSVEHPEQRLLLDSEDKRQAILYGVRYWARNQLRFLDEIFLEGMGGLMFPVYLSGPVPDSRILRVLRDSISSQDEWTFFSVRKVAATWGPQYRIPLDRLYGTLKWVYRRFPQYVVLIPTSESFATIMARSPQAEKYHLRGYFQDERGRYISHMRVHQKLKEVMVWPEILPV